jgi:excisionase family DNA binding protein
MAFAAETPWPVTGHMQNTIPPSIPSGRLFTYKEAAAQLGFHVQTVRRWFRGQCKFRVGNTVRIPESVLERWFREHLSAEPDRAGQPRRAKVDRVKGTKCPVERG